MEPTKVDKVDEGGSAVLVVLGDGAMVMGRINLLCVSFSNSFARQELGRMVMVGVIFLLAAAQRK